MSLFRDILTRRQRPSSFDVQEICSYERIYDLVGSAGIQFKDVSLGPDLAIYILILVGSADNRTKDGCSVKTQFEGPQTYIVLRIPEGQIQKILQTESIMNLHHVQPLPDNELLLVCSRCF
jgi:hypothetical protein